MKEGRITCNSMRVCVRKVEWLSMESKVPPDRREFSDSCKKLASEVSATPGYFEELVA